jgi:MFS family permease
MHATTASSHVPGSHSSPLVNRRFALLWVGQSISNLGDFIFTTTLALWIVTNLAHGASWAPLAVGAVVAVSALPDALVGPLSGVFVDRLDRRRLMMRMDFARAVLIAVLALFTGVLAVPALPPVHPSAAVQLAAVYLVVFLAGVCAQFFAPARLAIIQEIVPEPFRARASGLSQATSSLAMIAGPMAAAPLYFACGPGLALALNAVSFLVSFAALAPIRGTWSARPKQMQKSSYRQDLVEGLRFFGSNRTLRVVLVTACLVMLGAGCLNALDIFFLQQNLHASTQFFGLLTGAGGCGLLLGAVLTAVYGDRFGIYHLFWLGITGAGVLVLLYARLSSLGPAVAVLFAIGLPNAAVNVVIGPIIMQATPARFLGRVAAVFHPATALASLLSAAIAGWLASTVLHGVHFSFLGMRWSDIDLLFTGTGVLILAGGLHARARLGGQATGAPVLEPDAVSAAS